jgi:hypothetical protein
MDFSKMNGPQLVAAWNEMVLTAVDLGIKVTPVKKFADPATGRKRCEQLHASIQSRKAFDQGMAQDEKIERQQVKEENEAIPNFLKRSETPEQAAARAKRQAKHEKQSRFAESAGLKVIEPVAPLPEKIRKAIDKDLRDTLDPNKTAGGDAAIPRGEPKKKSSKVLGKALAERNKLSQQATGPKEPSMSKKKAKANGKTGTWMSNDAVITKLVKDNPSSRPGTKSYKLFEKIRSGMKVGAYKEAAGASAMPYLRWYIDHEFVKVTG